MRLRTRLVVPLALVGLAACLGVFVFGGGNAGATGRAAAAALTAAPRASSSNADQIAAGEQLFIANCSSCHEPDAVGSSRAPNLQGVGAATVDLWLSTGWMPLAEPTAQPENKPPRFTQDEIDAIVAYVTSLAPGGAPIPTVDLTNADVAEGFDIFGLNCAGCHTITGMGNALASGVFAPSLHSATAREVAEAVRTGPGNMPRFSPAQLSTPQMNSLIAYVVGYIQHPTNPGGIGLGGVGPVAEGFVGLMVGVGVCMLIALWIGDRTEREEDEEHGHGSEHGEHGAEGAHA